MATPYITNAQLRELVLESRREGKLSHSLIDAVTAIVTGLCTRYPVPGLDVEDVTQETLFRVMTSLHRIDVTKNVHSYVSTIARNVGRRFAERVNSQLRRMTASANRIRDEGGQSRPDDSSEADDRLESHFFWMSSR